MRVLLDGERSPDRQALCSCTCSCTSGAPVESAAIANEKTTKKPEPRDWERLRSEYLEIADRATAKGEWLQTRIPEMLPPEITLAAPVTFRVKQWDSLWRKLEQPTMGGVARVRDVHDVLGIRVVVLFRSDIFAAREPLYAAFPLVKQVDAANRLGDDRFGYSSVHLVLELPESGTEIPPDLWMYAEVQVRIRGRFQRRTNQGIGVRAPSNVRRPA